MEWKWTIVSDIDANFNNMIQDFHNYIHRIRTSISICSWIQFQIYDRTEDGRYWLIVCEKTAPSVC